MRQQPARFCKGKRSEFTYRRGDLRPLIHPQVAFSRISLLPLCCSRTNLLQPSLLPAYRLILLQNPHEVLTPSHNQGWETDRREL